MISNHLPPPFWVIIPAAGIGLRMKTDRPKQYLQLGSKTILEHTISCFISHPQLKGIVICTAKEDDYWPTIAQKYPLIMQAVGGKERVHTVISGLKLLQNKAAEDDWILVHDAARPNLQRKDLDNLLVSIKDDPVGGLLATPAKDTLKQVDHHGRVKITLDRRMIWQALTPQMFRYRMLFNTLQQAIANNSIITDEASAFELAGFSPRIIEGRSDNIKITKPEDFEQLMAYFKK